MALFIINRVLLMSVLLLFAFNIASSMPAPGSDAAAAICKLPPVRGHCRALLPRYRYDPATKTCMEFKFGGCDGNGNNFSSEKECMNMCAGV